MSADFADFRRLKAGFYRYMKTPPARGQSIHLAGARLSGTFSAVAQASGLSRNPPRGRRPSYGAMLSPAASILNRIGTRPRKQQGHQPPHAQTLTDFPDPKPQSIVPLTCGNLRNLRTKPLWRSPARKTPDFPNQPQSILPFNLRKSAANPLRKSADTPCS